MKRKEPAFGLLFLFEALAARIIWALRSSQTLEFLLFRSAAGLRALEIRFLSRSSPNYTEIDAGHGSVASRYWDYNSRSTRELETVTAPIGLWQISAARIFSFPKFPTVQTRSTLNFLPRNEDGPYNFYAHSRSRPGLQILREDGNHLLAKIPNQAVNISQCVYVGTRQPANWSHWLINFLPGVMVASDYLLGRNPIPLVVSPGFRDGEARTALFEYFWPQGRTLLCSEDEFIEAEEVLWFEQPYSDSPRPKNKEGVKPKSANFQTMTRFRQRLLAFARDSGESEALPDKVFLAREPNMSRPYNHAEVEAVASDAGYSVVYLNRLAVAHQIAIMAHAKRIVGPTGSAFANSIVAGAGAKLLELCSSARSDKVEDWYAPLADIAGAEFSTTDTTYIDEKLPGTLRVDTDALRRILSGF